MERKLYYCECDPHGDSVCDRPCTRSATERKAEADAIVAEARHARRMHNTHIVPGRDGERLIITASDDGVTFRLENDDGKWWYVIASHEHVKAIANLLDYALVSWASTDKS